MIQWQLNGQLVELEAAHERARDLTRMCTLLNGEPLRDAARAHTTEGRHHWQGAIVHRQPQPRVAQAWGKSANAGESGSISGRSASDERNYGRLNSKD